MTTTTSRALIPYDPRQGTPAAQLPSISSSPQDYVDYVTRISSSLRQNPDSERQFRALAVQQLDPSTLDDRSLDLIVTSFERLGVAPLELFSICLQDGRNEALAIRLIRSGKLDIEKDGPALLFKACSLVKINVIRALLEIKPNLALATDESEKTPLILLCASDKRLEADIFLGVRLLLENGAEIDRLDNEGRSAIAYSVRLGHANVVRLLIQHDASITLKTKLGSSLLHLLYLSITNEKCDDIAKMLIDAGVNVDELNNEGETPLIAACKNETCSADRLRVLLENGADVSAITPKGNFPLRIACSNEYIDKMELLVSYQADIYQTDGIEYSAFSQACEAKNAKHVAVLMRISIDQAKKVIEDYPRRVLLAHVNSLGHNDKQRWESYEGSYSNIMAGEIHRLLKSMPVELHYLTYQQMTFLLNAFTTAAEKNKNSEEIADYIKDEDLVILPSGFSGHIMALVFACGYLVICNRGDGIDYAEESIIAYKIDPSLITEDIVRKILDTKNKEKATSLDYIYEKLPRLLTPDVPEIGLGLEPPPKMLMQDEVCLSLQKLFLVVQENGTCAYASQKAALRVGAALCLLEEDGEGYSLSQESTAKAEEFSHTFSTYARLSVLTEYDVANADSQEDTMDVELRERSYEKTIDHIARHSNFKLFLDRYIESGYSPADLFFPALNRKNEKLALHLIEMDYIDLRTIGEDAIFKAVNLGLPDIVAQLLIFDEDLAFEIDKEGHNPLYYLCEGAENAEARKTILEMFARHGVTPLPVIKEPLVCKAPSQPWVDAFLFLLD